MTIFKLIKLLCLIADIFVFFILLTDKTNKKINYKLGAITGWFLVIVLTITNF